MPKANSQINWTNQLKQHGKAVKGDEPLRCFNTGVAAVAVKVDIKATGESYYIVGRQSNVQSNEQNIIKFLRQGKTPKIEGIKVYKTRKGAINQFEKLNNKMIESNQKDKNRIKKAKKENDLLTLSDYGVIG